MSKPFDFTNNLMLREKMLLDQKILKTATNIFHNLSYFF